MFLRLDCIRNCNKLLLKKKKEILISNRHKISLAWVQSANQLVQTTKTLYDNYAVHFHFLIRTTCKGKELVLRGCSLRV